MLTYNLSEKNCSLYKALYLCIKDDVVSGKLSPDTKMPSKRTLAKNLGISTITVENSYSQLLSEGYLYSIEKKGYFVADIKNVPERSDEKKREICIKIPWEENYVFDFSSNKIENSSFPFSVWAKLSRKVLASRQNELLEVSPCAGVEELRNAIAVHLLSFRGMNVDKNQIVVGAGTEYLYGLLIKLLGKNKIYCIENPGYKKIKAIYEANGAVCKYAELDKNGMNLEKLRESQANVAHISPNHHFPTGISMPVSRRHEILEWANEQEDRYIIEDDYDSEFRLNGNPLPPLQTLDNNGKVIYMNTFSKSLTSTIRISYMVLPEKLACEFYEKLSFYSCTVSTFEQYTLARFISEGFFEKHINRMRIHYGRKRGEVLDILHSAFKPEECCILENDSGLHFIMILNTALTDRELKSRLKQQKIKISTISDYEMDEKDCSSRHEFILNYSNLDMQGLKSALKVLLTCMKN